MEGVNNILEQSKPRLSDAAAYTLASGTAKNARPGKRRTKLQGLKMQDEIILPLVVEYVLIH